MSEQIWEQLRVFLIFAFYGTGLLLGNDLLQGWRKAVPHGPVWIGLEDVFFWFFAGLGTFVMIFLYQDGIIRLYPMIAMAVGMRIERLLFHTWVVNGVQLILKTVIRIVNYPMKKWKKERVTFM